MIVLSVCNHKGGTGKTTSVIHLAAALGLSGRKTLVVDLDPQGFLSRTMGIGEPSPDQSVAAFFDPEADLRDIDVREVSGFDLIPSSSTLTKRMRSLNKPTDVLWLREALRSANLEYDVVLFDTAAAVTVYSLNALVASEHVLIPVLPEYQAVVGGEQTYQTTELVQNKLNPLLQSRTLLLTQVDARKRIHRSYQEYLRKKYRSEVMETVVRTSTSLAESREQGTTVYDHDPQARGARDYANAADELLRRLRQASSNSREKEGSSQAETTPVESKEPPLPQQVLNS